MTSHSSPQSWDIMHFCALSPCALFSLRLHREQRASLLRSGLDDSARGGPRTRALALPLLVPWVAPLSHHILGPGVSEWVGCRFLWPQHKDRDPGQPPRAAAGSFGFEGTAGDLAQGELCLGGGGTGHGLSQAQGRVRQRCRRAPKARKGLTGGEGSEAGALWFIHSPTRSSHGQQIGLSCPIPDAEDAVRSSGRGRACPQVHLLQELGL